MSKKKIIFSKFGQNVKRSDGMLGEHTICQKLSASDIWLIC